MGPFVIARSQIVSSCTMTKMEVGWQGRLKVGVHALSASEAGLVRAQVHFLARNSDDFRWTFASEGPFDALIVAGRAADLSRSELAQGARAISSLGEPADHAWAGDVLPSPLDLARLESWLRKVCTLLQGAATEPGPLPVLPPVFPAEVERYRLKKWPPQALLHADTQRIRLSTLLSRRSLSIAELAQLSGETEGRCRTFVQLLQSFALLESGVKAPVAAVRRPTAPRIERGFIHKLRLRLGL